MRQLSVTILGIIRRHVLNQGRFEAGKARLEKELEQPFWRAGRDREGQPQEGIQHTALPLVRPAQGLARSGLPWLVGAGLALLGMLGWAASWHYNRGVLVQVARVGREDLQAKVTANGKVQAQKKVDVSATIGGQITHLACSEGDLVRKGQFLLQIDPVNPRAFARSSEFSMQALLRELDSARASYEQARADFRRAEDNHRGRIIADAEFERARTALATSDASVQAAQRRVDQAAAALEGAQDSLAKTTVKAPIDGIVSAKRVEEGEVAVIGVLNQPGTVLLTISDMSAVEIEMEVDETSIPSVKTGLEARIRIDAYPNRTFAGVVTEVGSSPIVKAGTEAIKFKVKAQIKDPPEGVKPGLSGQADILTGFRPSALVVPIQALILREPDRLSGSRREEEGVYLVEGGRVKFQPIKTGLFGELSLEVLEGLQGGETLVAGPFRMLRTLKPGDVVRFEAKKSATHTGN